jgi:hypothetical protein
MQVAYETGKDIEEVLTWPISKLELWVGFFNRKEQLRKQAEAREAARRRQR